MHTDPLATATERIRDLTRKGRSPLEATFTVSELMSDSDAAMVLDRLIAQRFLARPDADLAQMLATRLGREVRWQHAHFNDSDGWHEGRGQ
ncbi:MAG: hypothetical protein IT328_22990 [Caldilineaceae bacterium]|nr:hypothetical protein [Caldilineaceae bacterium]